MVDPDEEVKKFQYSIRVAQGGGGPSSAMRRMKDPMGSMWRWWHANDRKAGEEVDKPQTLQASARFRF